MKKKYKIRRKSLDMRADFGWWFEYNNEYKKEEEAKAYLDILAKECFNEHNIERHEDYFIDYTTQTRTEIYVI